MPSTAKQHQALRCITRECQARTRIVVKQRQAMHVNGKQCEAMLHMSLLRSQNSGEPPNLVRAGSTC
eukprot:7934904-Pyramimonas_sp.AAC.1